MDILRFIPHHDSEAISYAVRYIADVDKIRGQTIDPAHGKIPLRKFVSPEEFCSVVNWDRNGEVHLEKALEAYQSKLPFRRNCEGYFVCDDGKVIA